MSNQEVFPFSFDEIDGDTVINGSGLDINGTLEADAEQVTGYWGMGVALNPDSGEADAGQEAIIHMLLATWKY